MLQIADKQSAVPAVSLSAEDKDAKGSGTALEEVVLQNSNQFYRWHTELEAARTLETEEKYRRYADTLSGHLFSCDALLNKVCPAMPASCLATTPVVTGQGCSYVCQLWVRVIENEL